MSSQFSLPRARRWYLLSWPDWLLVAAIVFGMWLFSLSTTYVYPFYDGCQTALELSAWGWWIQPVQPFFSLALVAAAFTFALTHERRREKNAT